MGCKQAKPLSMALVERESTRTGSVSGPRELGEKTVTKLWVRYWEFLEHVHWQQSERQIWQDYSRNRY